MMTLTTTHGVFNGTSPDQIAKREFGGRAYVRDGLIVRRNAFRRTNLFIDQSDRVLSAILPDMGVF